MLCNRMSYDYMIRRIFMILLYINSQASVRNYVFSFHRKNLNKIFIFQGIKYIFRCFPFLGKQPFVPISNHQLFGRFCTYI